MVGGGAAVQMPAKFSGLKWELYEPETVTAFAEWVRKYPGGVVLDIGSSIGIFSAVALFANPLVKVISFDSDLSSLAACKDLCQHAKGQRLHLVNGFLTHLPKVFTASLSDAIEATRRSLIQRNILGNTDTPRYICLSNTEESSIPNYQLDDLFYAEQIGNSPVLIKCDVEGAELLVLRGGEIFLRRTRPNLLLSVHPDALPCYGHSKEDVWTFLNDLGYEIQCLAMDHEEHWWCEFKEKPLG